MSITHLSLADQGKEDVNFDQLHDLNLSKLPNLSFLQYSVLDPRFLHDEFEDFIAPQQFTAIAPRFLHFTFDYYVPSCSYRFTFANGLYERFEIDFMKEKLHCYS
eukprot:TRINITY_DN1121_c0_g1_i1.p1 TRINITY_DN1121_c0_g1~~TRINITY_DN1121_c0_g1_i1.p1  ORF type:complete len:105 (+),score=3.94 TRINITY_DN1121_c0_g1_i1:425-739(+)